MRYQNAWRSRKECPGSLVETRYLFDAKQTKREHEMILSLRFRDSFHFITSTRPRPRAQQHDLLTLLPPLQIPRLRAHGPLSVGGYARLLHVGIHSGLDDTVRSSSQFAVGGYAVSLHDLAVEHAFVAFTPKVRHEGVFAFQSFDFGLF